LVNQLKIFSNFAQFLDFCAAKQREMAFRGDQHLVIGINKSTTYWCRERYWGENPIKFAEFRRPPV